MTENNEVTGGAYDVPNVDDVYSPEQADAAINKLNAAWLTDDKHPYINSNHPQHQEFQDAVNKLYRVKFQDVSDETPLQAAMREGMEEQQEEQTHLVSESAEILSDLADFGWSDANEVERMVEKSIEQDGKLLSCEVDCMRMLLQTERKEWDSVIKELDSTLTQYAQIPSDIQKAMFELERLHKENASDETKRAYALSVLQYLRDAGRAKIGLPPRRPIGENDYDE